MFSGLRVWGLGFWDSRFRGLGVRYTGCCAGTFCALQSHCAEFSRSLTDLEEVFSEHSAPCLKTHLARRLSDY